MNRNPTTLNELEGTRLLDLLRCYDIWSATLADRLCGCMASWEEDRCAISSAT
jgi:hypothetical protein